MGETVNVTFWGIPSTPRPSAGRDWIGVWSPAPAKGNYSTRTPSKYIYVTPDATGAGSVHLWLVNMRESVTVAYFTGGLTTPVLIAESEAVAFDNVHLPMHVHLALTGDPTQMRVDWTSAQNGSTGPWIHWGDSRNDLSHSVKLVSPQHTGKWRRACAREPTKSASGHSISLFSPFLPLPALLSVSGVDQHLHRC